MQRKRALDADAVRGLPHREGLTIAAAAPAYTDPFEDLDALLLSLDDAHVHPQRVARPKRGLAVLQLLTLDAVDDVHVRASSSSSRAPQTRSRMIAAAARTER